MLHHDRYDAAPEAAERKAYDAEMTQVLRPPRDAGLDLDPAGAEPLGPIKSMNGRERMRAALEALGFEIR